MTRYVLFDNDGVLVDTESWYFQAGRRALADVGFSLDRQQYLRDMEQGLGTWHRARAAGVDEATIARQRVARDGYYRRYLATESIAIPGVTDVIAALARRARLAIVTTAKRADFDLIHHDRRITRYMDFVLTREDYRHAKPHPQPYLTALERFGATAAEALVVEDSQRGLASAVAAGIDCVIVHNDFTGGGDFSRARHRVDTLAGLLDLVETDEGVAQRRTR